MIASLPMYDRPETAAANDALWSAIRARLPFDTPRTLTRGGDLWDHWRAPDLVLSQTCGYPYRARLHGHVTLIGAPVHALPDCPPGHYNSVFVIRAEDTRDTVRAFASARFAFNEALSQSGWAAPQAYAAARGFSLSNPLQSGGHAASARAVAEGRADIAAVDALTWQLIRRHDPWAAALRELARTPPTPILPYITAPGRDADTLARAIDDAIAALAPEHRDALLLSGFVRLPAAAWLAVTTPPAPPADTPHLA